MNVKDLKIGDKIRIISQPVWVGQPGTTIPPEDVRFFNKLIKRKSPVRISEISQDGLPGFYCRFKKKNGRWEHHFNWIGFDDNNWIKCKTRK